MIPHKLAFFEVFSSAAAHEFHLELDYTKRLFAALGYNVRSTSSVTSVSSPPCVGRRRTTRFAMMT